MRSSSSRDRLEQALERIQDPAGEGSRACLTVYDENARAAADASDRRIRTGAPLSPLDGGILTIKDLFDVAGETTRAGSRILETEGAPAKTDAEVVRRLRLAGAVIVAKTNMSEFAFHGLGTNPHYGTPGNPYDRTRVPGGSTSGGAVAVADGMCEIAIGSDTGGSTRAPAAFCGIVGWKPSRQRVPTDGAFPLSNSLDSIGPMARTVHDCALADSIMAGTETTAVEDIELPGFRLGILEGIPLEYLDQTVSADWEECLRMLKKAGIRLKGEHGGLIEQMATVNAMGGFAPAEAFVLHQDRLNRRAADIDPNVRARIERGRAVSPEVYAEMTRMRRDLVKAMDERLTDIDGIILPTTPIVAPRIDEVGTTEVFAARNMASLRNTAIINFFDLCAISLPMPGNGLPTGLMIASRNGEDEKLFCIAAAIEKQFAGLGGTRLVPSPPQ